MSEDMINLDNNGTLMEVTVDQLLDYDMTAVEEVRGIPQLPEGIYEFRIIGVSNKTVTWEKNGEQRSSLVVDIEQEVISCRQCKDNEVDTASLAGKNHKEGFFMSASEDVGRLKAFLVDIGLTGAGSLRQLLDQCTNREYVAGITKRVDRNDKSKSYANLDRSTIQPIQPAPATAAPATSTGGINL